MAFVCFGLTFSGVRFRFGHDDFGMLEYCGKARWWATRRQEAITGRQIDTDKVDDLWEDEVSWDCSQVRGFSMKSCQSYYAEKHLPTLEAEEKKAGMALDVLPM